MVSVAALGFYIHLNLGRKSRRQNQVEPTRGRQIPLVARTRQEIHCVHQLPRLPSHPGHIGQGGTAYASVLRKVRQIEMLGEALSLLQISTVPPRAANVGAAWPRAG
jgi:hypothetical protein